MIAKELGCFVLGDSTKCTGCRACELACFAVHSQQKNQVGHTTGTVKVPAFSRLFVTRADESCMPVQCRHCEDAPCLNVCTRKAIQRINRKILVDEQKCIGCKDCMQACPFGAIILAPDEKNDRVVVQSDGITPKLFAAKCDLCTGIEGGPACVQACPHEALRLVSPEKEREEKNIRAAEALFLTRNWK